jgi:DNA processing protein
MSIDREGLLRLSAVPLIGSGKLRALIARFKSPAKVFNASIRELTTLEGIDTKTAQNIKNFDGKDFAQDQLKRLSEAGARLITFWDDEYPELLKQIYDPPAFFFIKGQLVKEDKNAIAIVGTRRPTHYGKLVTEKITTELAQRGLTIVSGLAYGIDTLAHTHALQTGGRTIAVLGSGVDVIYPSENRRLAAKIETRGALISEFPMGTEPEKNNFPRRNRIIGGLSLGTLVIEAGTKSGALITATMAIEQNREVFAVPGNIDSPKSIGTNELLKQGAKLVMSAQDILDELYPNFDHLHETRQLSIDDADLNDDEKKLLNLLSHEPQHIDALAQNAGRSTSQVLSLLLSLELKNLVKQLPGKYFKRF